MRVHVRIAVFGVLMGVAVLPVGVAGAGPGARVTAHAVAETQLGYVVVGSNGKVHGLEADPWHGSVAHPHGAVVGIALDHADTGYWVVTSEGYVYPFGAATTHGTTGGKTTSPIVGIATTPDDTGYWLATAAGGIDHFGTAVFHGSPKAALTKLPGTKVVGIAADVFSNAYWMVTNTGRVYAYGSGAVQHGTAAKVKGIGTSVVAICPTATDFGYWLVTSTGKVFHYGAAPTLGSLKPAAPSTGKGHVTGLAAPQATTTPGGFGYWMVRTNGQVAAFGSVATTAHPGVTNPSSPLVGIAANGYVPPVPTFSSLSVATGFVTGGLKVTVNGANFTTAGTKQPWVKSVQFGTVTATGLNVVSDTKLSVTTPPHAYGPVAVALGTPRGAATFRTSFTYKPPVPILYTINPQTGPLKGGTTIYVSGANFHTPVGGADLLTNVTLGGSGATNVVLTPHATVITFTDGTHAGGTAELFVTTLGGAVNWPNGFRYYTPPGTPIQPTGT